MDKIKQFIATHRHMWLVLFFVFYIVFFFFVEANTPTSGYWVTDLPIDKYIPFIPFFVYFYVIWYPLFVAVGVPTLINDGGAFKRWMYFLMAAFMLTMTFDILVPNGQGLRPENIGSDTLATWLLNRLWAADTPTNVFPSMHVLGCIGNIACVYDSGIFKKWMRIVITVLCVLCSASTVLVKQHAFIDVVGAVALAVPLLLVIYRKRIFKKKQPAKV